MLSVYCSTPQPLGVSPLSKLVLVDGTKGVVIADSDRDRFSVGAGTVTEPRAERLLKFAFQEALLNDRLQRGGEILNGHCNSLIEYNGLRSVTQYRFACGLVFRVGHIRGELLSRRLRWWGHAGGRREGLAE